MTSHHTLILAAWAVGLLVPSVAAGAVDLSLDAASPSVSMPDETDALSLGFFGDEGIDGYPFGFSVDRASLGAPGSAVAAEAAAGQAAGDIFRSLGGGVHRLWENQDHLGLIPALEAGIPAAPPIDNLDALGAFASEPGRMLSLVSGNTLGFSGADIVDEAFSLLVGAGDLGLTPLDDIDGLQGGDGNVPLGIFEPVYYFSLAPGSPSLAGGFSPADIFLSSGDGAFVLYVPAADLGLLATDNIDALATVPEARSVVLIGLALLTIGLTRGIGRSGSGR